MLKGRESLNLKQVLHRKGVHHSTSSRVSHLRSPDPPISRGAASVATDPFVTCEIYRSLTAACHDLIDAKHSYSHIREREKLRMRARQTGRPRENPCTSNTSPSATDTHPHPGEAWCSCCRVTLMPVKLNGRYTKGFLRYTQPTTSSQPAGTRTKGPRCHGGMWVWVCVCVDMHMCMLVCNKSSSVWLRP